MKQKKIVRYTIAIVIIVMLAIGIIWLCMPVGYENYVPEQAKAVVCIDMSKLTHAANNEDKALAQLSGIIPNGIDGRKECFIFVTPNEYIGFAAAVTDPQEIENFFQAEGRKKHCSGIRRINDRPWVFLNKGWLITWDEQGILALGPGATTEQSVLKQTMNFLLEGDKPFVHTDSYKAMKREGGSIKLYATLDALPTPYNLLFRMGLPVDCDPAAVQILAHAEVQTPPQGLHRTVVTSRLTSENHDLLTAIHQYMRRQQAFSRKEEKKEASLFRLTVGLSGKAFLPLLRSDATLRGILTGLNQTIDADQMIGTSNGPLLLEIDSLDSTGHPHFGLVAPTTSPSLFRDADYWLNSAKGQHNVLLKRTDANTFMLKTSELTLHFGREGTGQYLYFTNYRPEHITELVTKAKETTLPHGDLLTYFHIDLQRLFAQPYIKKKGLGEVLGLLLPGAQGIEYAMHSNGVSQLIIQ